MNANQINPPFDGSTPCPMCSVEVRNISAMIYNMLNRCRDDGSIEGKAFVKLFDMREYDRPIETVPHPAVTELLDCFDALKLVASDMTVEGMNIRWTPVTREKLIELLPRLRAARDAVETLSEAHFYDNRHSSGDDNILRERRGGDRHGMYDHSVEVVPDGGDLQHQVCGSRLKLHDYFKSRIAKDPLFYGRVWCPNCRINVPFAQFNRLTSSPA